MSLHTGGKKAGSTETFFSYFFSPCKNDGSVGGFADLG